MGIDPSVYYELETKYGAIQELTYSTPHSKSNSIIVRKPTFEEYIFFNKHSVPVDNVSFELDPAVSDIFFKNILVYPTNIDINDIPVGTILHACNISVKLSSFENKDKQKENYIKSIRALNTAPGAMLAKIVSAFGIQGYLACKHLSDDEIIDIISIIEIITDTTGEFAKIADIEGLPFDKRGKLDIRTLLGFAPEAPAKSKDQLKKESRLTAYYKSLGYNDEQIASLLSKLSGMEHKSNIKSDKLDLNEMSEEEINKISRNQFNNMIKENKVASNEESFDRALNSSKDALLKTLEEDKRLYGDTRIRKDQVAPSFFTGDLKNLLSDIEFKTRDL